MDGVVGEMRVLLAALVAVAGGQGVAERCGATGMAIEPATAMGAERLAIGAGA